MKDSSIAVGILFWLIFILGTIFIGFGVYRSRTTLAGTPATPFDGTPLFWWVLFLLLGIGTFGWPIKG